MVALVVACGGTAANGNGAAEPHSEEAGADTQPEVKEATGPDAQIENNLRQLLVDLTAANLCRRVEGSIIPLPGKAKEGGKIASAGLFWAEKCSIDETDPTHLHILVDGKGWFWVSTESTSAGAKFDVADYARFEINLDMVATTDLAYHAQRHIVTGWLKPTEPVKANLRVIESVAVDPQGVWAEILGGVASVVGKSPGERAQQGITEEGTSKLQNKLAEGLSVAMNLCTGRRATHLGLLPPGEMPEIAFDPVGERPKGSGRVTLQRGGLMLFGPFHPEVRGEVVEEQPKVRELVARIAMKSDGAVAAALTCEEEARHVFNRYMHEPSPPKLSTLDRGVIIGNQETVDIRLETQDCPIVVMVRPAESRDEPITFEWTVFNPGSRFEPLVHCP